MSPKVKRLDYRSPYILVVLFENNETREFDLAPYLSYPIYQKLKDESYCRRAKILYGIITWDDDTDLDPDLLYLESKKLTPA